MLAYENLFMGLIALVVGIGIGALLSVVFTKLLLVLMDSRNGCPFRDSSGSRSLTRPLFSLSSSYIHLFKDTG
ncbi:hypothetical protein P7H12_13770 [Paenibacillus larvae]|nr:hypothetical protein [Paenibacillus larvae]